MVVAAVMATDQSRLVWLPRTGLILQLFGFAAVWKQLRDAIEEHGRPDLWKRLTSWWKARPKSRDVTVGLTGVSAGAFTGSATGRVRRAMGSGSPEARLDAIEYNFAELQTEFDAFRRDAQQGTRDLRALLEEEQRARAAATGELTRRIEQQAVGSTDLQLVGLVWFVFGSVYSTVPDLVVSLLHL